MAHPGLDHKRSRGPIAIQVRYPSAPELRMELFQPLVQGLSLTELLHYVKSGHHRDRCVTASATLPITHLNPPPSL